ncbi:hypothetical protein A2U01_0055668, partial [Trifolium medium]|nr:hypothetical protein [Trifolium medium]
LALGDTSVTTEEVTPHVFSSGALFPAEVISITVISIL